MASHANCLVAAVLPLLSVNTLKTGRTVRHMTPEPLRRRALVAIAAVGVLGAPGLTVAQPAGTGPRAPRTHAQALDRASARPFSAVSTVAVGMRDSLVALAREQVGRRYRLGGTSPRGGFDCSGLVRYVASALRISLPRTAAEQARFGLKVTPDTGALRPGDLLAFGIGRISHVGIYVGGGRMVHASSRAGRVIESRLDPRFANLPLRGARRVVLAAAPATDQAWLPQ